MKIPALFTLIQVVLAFSAWGQTAISYTLSVSDPKTHQYQVSMKISGITGDQLTLKMPQWHPGYYRIMEYGKDVHGFRVKGDLEVTVKHPSVNTWQLTGISRSDLVVEYAIQTHRKFVANSYVEEGRAYIIPENTFMYVSDKMNLAPQVKIVIPTANSTIATGLDLVNDNTHVYIAENYDILYDCPILVGDLEELSPFDVGGKIHRFIGYQLGSFDRELFMDRLQAIVKSASDIIGDIPYEQYTFIAIGPGRGGIEHLNNTTVSFDGNQLKSIEDYNRVLNFLAHEYFHHYNVKRIRPYELGPFDYENGNRTNLLWVSEGLSVYYEYIITRRAGISNDSLFLANFSRDITSFENSPGKSHQSLAESSFYTWSNGPFGSEGIDPEKSISYYVKGPIVGLLLDLAIRHASKNQRSLDDVMRLAYQRYYHQLNRGFTDVEFNSLCEEVAGTALSELFQYVYTPNALNYDMYLAYAGLVLVKEENAENTAYTIRKSQESTDLSEEIFASLVGE
ncbi:M61 family metallopeptidase [Marinoscillum sp.]|uniref:M61 family metallopeptidase n=1 Tax=Marinoscillum sp. TaxID=2024838 RepID=UPI003BADA7EA